MSTEKQLVAGLPMTAAMREVVNLLARIDQSLTGKDDQSVWHTARNQWDKMEDIILGRDVYYFSDGGMSRLSLNCDAASPAEVAFVTSNSTDRVKWLWDYETGFRIQLRRALAAWVEEYQRKAASA